MTAQVTSAGAPASSSLGEKWAHLWLLFVYSDGLVARIPVWAQPQKGLDHPRPVSAIQVLAQRSCHIGKTQMFQPLKGSDFQRLLREQGLLIGSADVSPAHPLL